jgi:hypothetical protein
MMTVMLSRSRRKTGIVYIWSAADDEAGSLCLKSVAPNLTTTFRSFQHRNDSHGCFLPHIAFNASSSLDLVNMRWSGWISSLANKCFSAFGGYPSVFVA